MSGIFNGIGWNFATGKIVGLLLFIATTVGLIVYVSFYFSNQLDTWDWFISTQETILNISLLIWITSILFFLICFENIRGTLKAYFNGGFTVHFRIATLIGLIAFLLWPGFFVAPTFYRDRIERQIIEKSALKNRINDALQKYSSEQQWLPIRAKYVQQIAEIQGEIELLKTDEQKDIVAQHEAFIHFILRSLSLGALGALVVFIPKHTMWQPNADELGLFNKPNYWELLITHIFLGSTVSVVILGLLYTKLVSVYADTGNSAPENWRVTIFCVVSGVFSDRIYRAAVGQLEKYIKALSESTGAKST